MRRKKAIITFDLVDESIEETDRKIEQELIDWFQENAMSIPWVKSVKAVIVRDE
jgi:hypothetical protein